jgi:hypothetical protein
MKTNPKAGKTEKTDDAKKKKKKKESKAPNILSAEDRINEFMRKIQGAKD